MTTDAKDGVSNVTALPNIYKGYARMLDRAIAEAKRQHARRLERGLTYDDLHERDRYE
jgi:hypothetical protein